VLLVVLVVAVQVRLAAMVLVQVERLLLDKVMQVAQVLAVMVATAVAVAVKVP
jgi:DNA-binding protein Fis